MAASPPPEGPGCWLASLPAQASGRPLATAQLAWLGDAVWELHQRLRQCQTPGRAADLHRAVVAEVQAEAQAQALRRLEPLLREEERRLVLRGRNQAGRGPRRGSSAAYGQATGFETMLGWLFLQNPRRLAELLDHLEKTEPCPPSASP
ncbi:MAG: ribonuclease III [Cyanobium sp. CACIAM 14]|nr:MAG: ribonuclease III [Cyanobium sp. CACIAM 14]